MTEKEILTPPEILYECDPILNTKCRHYGCQHDGGCYMTRFKEYARRDSYGQPIIAATFNWQTGELKRT